MKVVALASDYDGTLAHDGHVSRETIAAIERLRSSGRKFFIVTGRELPELKSIFAELRLCDGVVAENGGLLYFPQDDSEQVLGESLPEQFLTEVSRREIKPFSVGKVIFASWRPHEGPILEVIQNLGLGHQIVFNKDAVMVLPAGVNKASGLSALLKLANIEPVETIAVGDAENDHVFFDFCGLGVAVANALPAVKERCDLVMHGDHGDGVIELIDRILSEDLPPARVSKQSNVVPASSPVPS
ncbi:MAG: HAD family hydrolase [Pirellulales bacterium]